MNWKPYRRSLSCKTEFHVQLVFPSEAVEDKYRAEKKALEGQRQIVPHYFSEIYCYRSKQDVYLNHDYQWRPTSFAAEVIAVKLLLEQYLGVY